MASSINATIELLLQGVTAIAGLAYAAHGLWRPARAPSWSAMALLLLFASGLALVGPQRCVPPSSGSEEIMWDLMVIAALVAAIGTIALAFRPWSSAEPAVPLPARSVAQDAAPPRDVPWQYAPLSPKTGPGRACQRGSAPSGMAALAPPCHAPTLAGRTGQRITLANRARPQPAIPAPSGAQNKDDGSHAGGLGSRGSIVSER